MKWATDNSGAVYLNNSSTPISGSAISDPNAWSNFMGWSPPFVISASSGLLQGENTLKFVVRNSYGYGDGPTALRVHVNSIQANPRPITTETFSISATTPDRLIRQGTAASIDVKIDRSGGYNGPVNFTGSFGGGTGTVTAITASGTELTKSIPVTGSTPGPQAVTISATGTTGSPAPTATATTGVTVYTNGQLTVPVSSVNSNFRNGEADPNFALVESADWKFPGLAARTLLTPTWLTGPNLWYSESGISYWISPRAVAVDGNAPGVYKYQTRFYLNELDVAGASVGTSWVVDNNGTLRVNGMDVCSRIENPPSVVNYQYPAACPIGASFLRDGENVIEYEITNGWTGSNPTGVWVKHTGGQANTKTIADYTLVPVTGGPAMATAQVSAGSGGSQTFSFKTTPINGFSWPTQGVNPIVFSAEPITPAATGLASSVSGTATGASLTVNYTSTTPVGTYTIPIKAIGGGRTKYASALLRIGPTAPSVLGLTPPISTQASQMFTLKAQPGSLGIYRVQLLFNTAVSGTNDCTVLLQADGTGGWLAKLSPQDWVASGYSWLGPVTVGQSGGTNLNNGRCTLNHALSSASIDPATGTYSWNLSMSRLTGWGGNRTAYMLITTEQGFEDGWSEIGGWNVP